MTSGADQSNVDGEATAENLSLSLSLSLCSFFYTSRPRKVTAFSSRSFEEKKDFHMEKCLI